MAASLLDHPVAVHFDHSNGYGNSRIKSQRRDICLKINSFRPATNGIRHDPSYPGLRVPSFRWTVRALQLDHSDHLSSTLSWLVASILLVVVPVLRLCFVKAVLGDSEHELVFQPLVVVVGMAQSAISFLFLSQTIRTHGLRGVLFIDAAEEEAMEVQNEYNAIIERDSMQLAKLFAPALLFYIIYRCWFCIEIELEPLPFETTFSAASLVTIILPMSAAWIFQTTTYLYTCILFSTVCALQELKMRKFKDLLGKGFDPEFYFDKYVKILRGLHATSRRFRLFLALIMTIDIAGFLASMYEIVVAQRAGIDMLLVGEILVLNMVSLTGLGLCLKSASKLSHHHRRIIKAAASMHAQGTFEVADFEVIYSGGKDTIVERLDKFCQMQDAWSRRAALVTYLSSFSAGISVYGFVLDRFIIHTSIGALLTTTWFILGRSLS